MPKYKVDTDQGAFMVELDQPPESLDQLRSLVQDRLSGGQTQGQQAVAAPTQPEQSMFRDPGGNLRLPNPVDVLGGAVTGLNKITEAAGEFVGEPARAGTQALIESYAPESVKKHAPEIAAGVGTAANVGTQFYAPGKVVEGVVGGINLAKKGLQAIAPKLPGAAVALRESARKLAEGIPGRILPAQPSDELYALVNEMNPNVKLPSFARLTGELAAKEAKLEQYGLGSEKIAGVAGKTGKALKETPQREARFLGDLYEQGPRPSQLKEVSFSEVETIRRRIGERLGELRKQGGEELGAYKQMFKSLSDDLEQAAEQGVGPAFQALKAANKAARREFASGEVGEIVTKAIQKREGTNFENISFSQIYNKFKAKTNPASGEYDELFAKSFTPGETSSILKDTFEMSKIPVPPPPKGLNVGSGLINRRAGIGGTAGGLIGGAITGTPMGATMGGLAGGLTTIGGAEVVSKILQSNWGRKTLIKFLNAAPYGINAQNINVLNMIARGITGENLPPTGTGEQ
jgi:hypothetical protein